MTSPNEERLQKQFGLSLEALEAIADGEGTAQVIARQTLDDIVRVGMEAIALETLDGGPPVTERLQIVAWLRRQASGVSVNLMWAADAIERGAHSDAPQGAA